MGQHNGWPVPPEVGSVWTMQLGPYEINYFVVDVYPDGTVVMEDEDHEVRIVDTPDGVSTVQEFDPEFGWVEIEDSS